MERNTLVEKLNVCYASSNEYVPYMCVSIISLLKNNTDLVENIYLLSFGIKEENLKKLKDVIKQYNCSLVVIDALSKMSDIFKKIELSTFDGSYATYARAFISELITDYEGKILYIDSDTVIDGSLEDLLRVDMDAQDKAYAAVIGANQYYIGNTERLLANGNKTYFACGVILFNLRLWKKYKCTENIIEYISKNGSDYLYADQTVINNAINEKLVLPLHPKYNYWGHVYRGARIYYELLHGGWWSKAVIDEAKANPVIIHYKGFIVHPWLKGNVSSLSHRYQYYKQFSPWKDEEEKSIYYDEVAKCETDAQKEKMDRKIKFLRKSAYYLWFVDYMRIIKRKIKGEYI
jgi:lipopolysaccharide biosynthesis glycosyltransferase